ncbi:hypothetical protein BJV78DRAFT_861428, partial [Lactifluus subvellereus]
VSSSTRPLFLKTASKSKGEIEPALDVLKYPLIVRHHHRWRRHCWLSSRTLHALSIVASTSRATPLRIALLERSLSEPDRIVGELLQPGGVAALRSLGIAAALDGIDAIPVHGYAVLDAGQIVHIPYPSRAEGRSFQR